MKMFKRPGFNGRRLLSLAIMAALLAAAPVRPATADNNVASIAAGTCTYTVAVNPATNKVYVVNYYSNNITVIDGATDTATTVTAGTTPRAVAVNPATNKIYVANFKSNDVTVIDGATNATATVPVGSGPRAVAIDSAAGKIYVADFKSNDVTVIDGATNATATVPVGANPYALAVNPATGKIYVSNYSDNTVTVIDGATNATTALPAGTNPQGIAVNPVTNKIYVVNGDNTVTVIDGATGNSTNVAVGTTPYAVTVNPVTNRIYVVNGDSNDVTVIDGTGDTVIATVAAGTTPWAVTVNLFTNKIYVPNHFSADMTVIDGATNAATTVAVGTQPCGVAVNPVTGKAYVANYYSNDVTVVDGATNSTDTIAAGKNAQSIAFNPATGKVYVANTDDNDVTVIEAGSGTVVATVATGESPYAVAVNPATGKAYTANFDSDDVTVIDGATNAATTIPAGAGCCDVGVNPATGKAYVTNFNSGTVSVIDGATDTVIATVTTATTPRAVAVNPATNKIYIPSERGNNVSVIDGATDTVIATVAVGTQPEAAAVNPVTNKIYVPNFKGGSMSVIDGATDTVIATVTTGARPYAVAVNPNTNKIYVASYTGGSVTVIDGATDTVIATVTVGSYPCSVAVNPATDRIYVTNVNSGNVTVIDGVSNGAVTVGAGTSPCAIAVDAAAGRIYVANADSGDVTVISETAGQDLPVTVSISPLAGNQAAGPSPTLSLAASSSIGPVQQVWCQVDGGTGPWDMAAGGSGSYTYTASGLKPGAHTLYAFATDGQDATSADAGWGINSLISQVGGYTFVVPAPVLTGLVLSGEPALSYSGSSLTYDLAGLTLEGSDQFGAPFDLTGQTVAWAVYAGPATIGGDGHTLTITGNGTVEVTAAIGAVTSNILDLTVTEAKPVLTGLVLSGEPALSYSGSSLTYDLAGLTLEGSDQFGAPFDLTGQTVAWAVYAGPATIGGDGHTLTITGNGTVEVTAAIGAVTSNTLGLDIGRATPVLTSLALSGAPGLTYSGSSLTYDLAGLTLEGSDQFGAPFDLTGQTVAWVVYAGPATIGGGGHILTVTSNGTVEVNAAIGAVTSNILDLTVAGTAAITLKPAALPDGTVGKTYSQKITASGGKSPYTYKIGAGALPPGISFKSGSLSGKPTEAGSYAFTVTAAEKKGFTGSRSYTLTVKGYTITLKPTALAAATVGKTYSQKITASGGKTPYTFTIDGALPAGITFKNGAFSGKPTEAGSYAFTVTAADKKGFTGSRSYTLTVKGYTITLKPTALAAATVGKTYSQKITASGGKTPYTFTIDGALPAGITFKNGAFSGKPTEAGSFDLTVTATDKYGLAGSRAYTLSVKAAK